ncbi:phosphate:Na+ symporter [Ensifer adhaerens]|uniref:Phosphate:Na+ symporter n=1 Tax=Ensifer adhaerens TaxID=106592 RepID=A0ACC5T4S1_ENSAD|nr:Na/Pi cotransporter family protein [Ensifer adhaerens]MBP1876078.1 phosphate:Na+ symporter [Ensifer adhaerens]
MSGSVIFLHLAGAVALLLWATRLVRTGIERAYGGFMRQRLREALGNRAKAAVAGFLLAISLQSATAVALIVSGFVASGYVGGGMGIATLLGADLGSAFVTKLLRHDLSLLVPCAFVLGTISYRTDSRRWREIGRIIFGLGLLLLSLRLIGEASLPLKESRMLPFIISYLSQDWISAFLLAALLAWAFHSSIAAILLFASFTEQGIVPSALIIPFVLGINFGGAVIGAALTRGEERAARIVPLGNVMIRGIGMLIALGLQLVFQLKPEAFFEHAGDAVVWVHIAANGTVLVVGLPLSMVVAQALDGWLSGPDKSESESLHTASALNIADVDNPTRALDNATREVVAMCDKVELMLTRIFDVYEKPDARQIAVVEQLDDQIDRYNLQIKMYLARVSRGELSDEAARRQQDLLGASINLEQVGDLISQSMLAKARKKHSRNTAFSKEGWQELSVMHQRIVRNARLAFNLIVNRDVEHARQLVREKEIVRDLVRESEEKHIHRLATGNSASIETSSLHIDTMRDIKEINSLLVSIAYPVLSQAGLLRASRLL